MYDINRSIKYSLILTNSSLYILTYKAYLAVKYLKLNAFVL